MNSALRLIILLLFVGGTGWAVFGAEEKAATKKLVPPEAPKSTVRLQTPAAEKTEAAVSASKTSDTSRSTAAVPSSLVPRVHVEGPSHMSLGTLNPTPEMWFYEQARQDYDNTALQVRRRAERDAAERHARLASQEWYGYSSARPVAHITPFTYYYSPMWGASRHNPFIWTVRTSSPAVIETKTNVVGVSGFGAW